MSNYVGHTSTDGRIQTLSDHLERVADLCSKFAHGFGAAEWGRLLGLAHDIGKYSLGAQKRMLDGGPKVDHSTAGGQEINRRFGPVGAYMVFGHHGAGLPDGGTGSDTEEAPTLCGRLKKPLTGNLDYSAFSQEVALDRPADPPILFLEGGGFSLSFLIRMLFSCLVDADFLDTERFMNDTALREGEYDTIETLHQKLIAHLERFQNPKNELYEKRNKILRDCIQKAELPPGLFSLTVPTGGGKTISSLAFALAHAKKHGLKRVIYVIPYTSIIEQNAAVFAEILGENNVLEHHSNVDYGGDETERNLKDPRELSAENWDMPVVVTTNVQFFESLFAAKGSRCRKLHNIAQSVVIFDEAQMIPYPFLRPCTRAIGELVHNYGCSAVLCTATQPALDNFFPQEIKRTEICEDAKGLYEFFRRVTLERMGELTVEQLAERLNAHGQALCVVSTRKQARRLYSLLEGEGNYHLSTWMYPEHRKRVLIEIRACLKEGLPCRVVSTSLIEAGVDVDFPVGYREKTGLDSILQAAGRVNREGKNGAQESKMYIFELPDSVLPLSMKQYPAAFDSVARDTDDITSLDTIHRYFSRLYRIKGDDLDRQHIVERMEAGVRGVNFPFRKVAEEFRLIGEQTRLVVIPLESRAKEAVARLRNGEHGRGLLREAARYGVNVFEYQFQKLKEKGMVEDLDGDGQIGILADVEAYTEKLGLDCEMEGGRGIIL